MGNSEIVGEYGVRPLYRQLGYFSIIGLLRVHCLLGDFTLALKVMENVELTQKVRPSPSSPATLTDIPCVVVVHARDRVPRHDVLLRRLLLHNASAVPGRDPHVRLDPELHLAHEAVPYAELSV